jgi:hypothetical protein
LQSGRHGSTARGVLIRAFHVNGWRPCLHLCKGHQAFREPWLRSPIPEPPEPPWWVGGVCSHIVTWTIRLLFRLPKLARRERWGSEPVPASPHTLLFPTPSGAEVVLRRGGHSASVAAPSSPSSTSTTASAAASAAGLPLSAAFAAFWAAF